MKQAIITAIVMTIIIILAVQYEKYELKQATTCTPSSDHLQLLEQQQEIIQQNDFLIDMLNKDENL